MLDVELTKDDYLGSIRRAVEALARDRKAVADGEHILGLRIREALRHDCSVIEIAGITGLSRERIYQIRDRRR